MKTCPKCAERDLQDAALVCKHCGANLGTLSTEDRAVMQWGRWKDNGKRALAAGIAIGAGAALLDLGSFANWLAGVLLVSGAVAWVIGTVMSGYSAAGRKN